MPLDSVCETLFLSKMAHSALAKGSEIHSAGRDWLQGVPSRTLQNSFRLRSLTQPERQKLCQFAGFRFTFWLIVRDRWRVTPSSPSSREFGLFMPI